MLKGVYWITCTILCYYEWSSMEVIVYLVRQLSKILKFVAPGYLAWGLLAKNGFFKAFPLKKGLGLFLSQVVALIMTS